MNVDAYASPRGRVAVLYEPSRRGDAALEFAVQLAADRGGGLTVLMVAPHHDENLGCLSCRANAQVWNRELERLTAEELGAVAELLDGVTVQPVRYLAAYGERFQAARSAALDDGAQTLVVPFEPARRLGILPRRTLAGRLDRDGALHILSGPERPARAPRWLWETRSRRGSANEESV